MLDMTEWDTPTPTELATLQSYKSKLAQARELEPSSIYVKRSAWTTVPREVCMVAMQYIEHGKFERWSIAYVPFFEIIISWSDMLSLIRPLISDRTAIEVYPRDEDIVNTAPVRWFWVLPSDYQSELFDLHAMEPAQ